MQQRSLHLVAALTLLLAPLSTAQTVVAAQPPPASTNAHIASAGAPVRATLSGLRREIFGFALASSLSNATMGYPTWDFRLLTTVAFFGLHVTSAGTIASDSGWSVWNSSATTTLLTTAHSHGVKVVATIVLQDFSPDSAAMCQGLENRARTVAQVATVIAARHADGVNVDYESGNLVCPNGQSSRDMLTDFVRLLRAALPAGAYLSVDTYASSAADPIGFFDVPGIAANADSMFVMAYDMEYSNWRRAPASCAAFCLGPTAPLTGYYYNDTTTLAQYKSVVAPSKVILGVPYYGRKACVAAAAPNATPTSGITADSYLTAIAERTADTVKAGSYAVHVDPNDTAGHQRYDTWYNTSLHCTRQLYWDDATSLGAKYDLVNSTGVRGVGIWNLNYGGGASELWNALRSHFMGCAGVSATATPPSPALATTPVTVTATGSCPNPSPSYEFWVKSPNASRYVLAQAYSTSATFTWKTAGLAPGAYRINVWVRDAVSAGAFKNSSGSWDAFNASLTYSVTSDPCNGVKATAAASTAMVGTAIKVTAAATGCTRPSFEFWTLAPGATQYRLAQAYSTNSTFTWNTSGLAPGSYRVNVWTRDATSVGRSSNSSGSWDAFDSSVGIRLTAGCPAVSAATATPTGSAAAGIPVTLSATASGCAHPLYEFWILAPGASAYRLGRAYASGNTFAWSTTGLTPGMYRINVWVRDSASAGTFHNASGRWDAYNDGLTYTVNPSCKSVKTTSTSTSVHAGTGAGVTAAASGCPNPVYEFWVLAPGEALYTLAQAYSTSATFHWSTTGLRAGTYRITVWVRDAASTGVSGNSSGRWDAYDAHMLITVS